MNILTTMSPSESGTGDGRSIALREVYMEWSVRRTRVLLILKIHLFWNLADWCGNEINSKTRG